jgi:hypothetical protein
MWLHGVLLWSDRHTCGECECQWGFGSLFEGLACAERVDKINVPGTESN